MEQETREGTPWKVPPSKGEKEGKKRGREWKQAKDEGRRSLVNRRKTTGEMSEQCQGVGHKEGDLGGCEG